MRAILLLILLLFAPTPPPFTARWDRPGVARLVWSQPPGVRETCLYREPAHATGILVQCWNALSAGPTVLRLGASAGLDGAFRPVAGDSFVLTQDGAQGGRAALRGVVWLGVVTR